MYEIVRAVTTLALLFLLLFVVVYGVFAVQRVAKLNCERVYGGTYHYFGGCEYSLPGLEQKLRSS